MPPPPHNSSKRALSAGFTLLELSVVLIIIGLIVGGVLVGQSLIHAAQMRTVVNEYQKFTSAVFAFRDKYGAFPGDMSNADQFFGCTSCDGNNDGTINWGASYTRPEVYYFWQHLALANMIPGSYTGVGVANPTDDEPGINVPESRLSNGVYWRVDNLNLGGIGSNYDYSINYGNFFTLAQKASQYSYSLPLTPQDASDIDSKIDDGKPGTGKVIGAVYYGANGGVSFGANTCTTSANSGDFSGLYNISLALKVCNLAFVRQF